MTTRSHMQRWMKSEPIGAPSSHWTTALGDQKFFVGLFLLTVFHLWLSGKIAPAEDELYYWAWAKDLQWSYFDHPPMVAYWIAVSTKVFGDNLFAIRLPSCLAAAFILTILKVMGRASLMLSLLMFTPLFLLGSVLMTPDTPLLVFWMIYLAWMTGLNEKLSQWSGDPVQRVYHATPIELLRWIAGGAILGLGFLSKYTMAIAVPCAFATLLFRYRLRAWLTGFAVHLLVAGLIAFPVFYYNLQHDFIPFKFQWANAISGGGGGIRLAHFADFFGSQLVLIGLLPFLLLPWVLINRQELDRENCLHVYFCFYVFPILFFLAQSFRTKLEANWGLVAYLSFWPIAQRMLERSSFPLFRYGLTWISFAVPLVASGGILFHLLFPSQLFPVHKDRTGKFKALYELSQEIGEELAVLPERLPVFAANYQWTSYLRFQKVEANQLHPSGRMSNFTVAPKEACANSAIYVVTDPEEEPSFSQAVACFADKKVVKTFPLRVRGTEVGKFVLYRYAKVK